MSKLAFVSASDSNYYPMLLEWIHSIRRFPKGQKANICIMDAGLSAEQIARLQELNCKTHAPDWPCDLPASQIRGRDYLKGCVCRPFINQYFPGYETYIWMDPDTWIQKWEAIETFIQGAQDGAITLTSQTDRAYQKQVRIKWLGTLPLKVRGFYFSNAKAAYGAKIAKKLYDHNVLLAGMFALRGDAPHWEKWQSLMIDKLQKGKGKIFTSDQLTLGRLCYLENYPYTVLPAYMHWLCETKPLWDESKNLFVEPFLPHEEIGILHLSGWDRMRLDRSENTDFETLNGQTITHTYRYPYYDGEKDQEINLLKDVA